MAPAEREDQAGAGAGVARRRRVQAEAERVFAEVEEQLSVTRLLAEAEEAGTDDDVDDTAECLIAALHSFTTASPLAALAKNSPDCVVCYEPFNAEAELRLLPACRHAFHAVCIAAWLRIKLNCPICRRAVTFPLPPLPVAAAAAAAARDQDQEPQLGMWAKSGSMRGFSVELGGVSDRRSCGGVDEQRTYSIGGSFDYRVDEEFEAFVSRIVRPAAPGEAVAEAVESRGWLGDYLDHIAGASSATPSV